jgi:hypothetical protein
MAGSELNLMGAVRIDSGLRLISEEFYLRWTALQTRRLVCQGLIL